MKTKIIITAQWHPYKGNYGRIIYSYKGETILKYYRVLVHGKKFTLAGGEMRFVERGGKNDSH